MTVAVVVVAPADVLRTAEAWARLGLVGDSLWVSAEGLTSIDHDAPNALVATYLRFEHEPFVGPLAVQLAELGSLEEARIAWLRGTDATNESLLKALDVLARELLPYDQVHWLDVVAPQRRTDESAVPLAGDWIQFRIHPSDRPAPDVADAGWDLGLAVPLHVTLALTGILGGVTRALPWARLNAAQSWVVRVFSRMVDGGLEARRQAWRFVVETLPTTHAAEQHPAVFLAAHPAGAARIVESATADILAGHGGALEYRAPAASEFRAHPRLSVGRHLLNFLRFLPLGLEAVLGIRREPQAVSGSVLEFEDLGYSVGKRIEAPTRSDGIPDFAAMEASALRQARQELDALSSREGASPPAEAWEPLAQIATALIDGGSSLPDGWTAPTSHDQRLSLPPGWVVLGSAERVASETPELALAENLAVAAEAFEVVRVVPVPPLQIAADPRGVTATAVRLTKRGNDQDAEAFGQQLSALDPPMGPPTRPRSLLDRLRGRVVGGLLRARLDAERWTEAASRGPEGSAPDWGREARLLRPLWWIAMGACVLVGVLWYVFHEPINAALGTSLGLEAGLWLSLALLLVVALVVLYVAFRRWNAFLEQGRRRLESIALWLDRAARARTSHAALMNAERTSRAWANLLSNALQPGSLDQADGADIHIERAPFSLRVGHPRFRAEQIDGWLARLAAQPGWRLSCLEHIVGEFLGLQPDRALQQLARDPALPGGRLDRLVGRLPELATEWQREVVTGVWAELRDQISVNADRLEVPRSPGLPSVVTRVEPFLAELTPDDGELPWAHDFLVPSVTSAPGTDSALVLVLSAALSTARLRIQVQPLEVTALVEPLPASEDDVASDFDLPR